MMCQLCRTYEDTCVKLRITRKDKQVYYLAFCRDCYPALLATIKEQKTIMDFKNERKENC